MLRLLAFAILILTTSVQAHQIAEMTMSLEADGDEFRATIQADAAYMLPEYRGDVDVVAQDLAWLRQQDQEEWQRIRDETVSYLRQCLTIRTPSGEVEWQASFPDFEQEPPIFVNEGIAEMPPMIEVLLRGSFPSETLSIAWDEPFGVVLIVQVGDETIPIVSGYAEPLLHRDGDHAEPVTPSLGGWIRLGFRHIIPDGLDHLLFILGIFLLQPRWKTLVLQSLVFTLAHSLTLGLSAIGWVQLPDYWVELAIAASIAWIGIENLSLKEVGKGRYALITVFGLIHGLGFARMLTPLLPDDRPDALLFGIAGFNIGVELGQVLVLAIAFAIFGWWKEASFNKLSKAGSAVIALAGLGMLATRIIAG
ncbi:HupE/UreJ family protein [Haloferula sp.]|uniref:HupE/UreJ family protein n=1 Tax=Haloferula sp. TaxID=2497595 RepID=UPI00329CA300